eukprot:TRINITY_DN4868_c0_g1_i2.p1 TRINITY_DN4868_c0_g1~~TRINITY_DN4868_c0_g1_i2.p1  ORF type:complete len:372 (+),score=34.33 TRINITY_DN4868_c0_g1_i2:46-1161(+)
MPNKPTEDQDTSEDVANIRRDITEAKRLFRESGCEACGRALQGVERRVKGLGMSTVRFVIEEEVRWLLGMVQKVGKNYQRAVDLFDEALVCSENLFIAGERTPSKVCMEALRARGTCHLIKYSYTSAVYDFKEWLKLRDMFWPEMDPVSVLYNLGLCYKAMCMFAAAEFWLEKSLALAKHGGIKQERNFRKAKTAVALLKEVSRTTSEDILIEEVLKLQISPTETPLDLASKLLSLRTRVQCYLARTSWEILNDVPKRKPSTSRWLPLRLVSTPPPSPTQPQQNPRKVIINVATSFLTRLLGGGEATIRKYLTNGTAPAVLPLLDASSIKTALRQTLNFAAEFTLNYQKMAVWDAVVYIFTITPGKKQKNK